MTRTTDRREPGTRIGDYVIERELAARPGYVTWLGSHALLPRRARISTVRLAAAGAPVLAAQLTREACLLEVLHHPGVPRVFECGQLPDGRPWLACELVEAPSLVSLLREEGALGVPRLLALLAGLAEILHHAHTRGLVHRNLRPEAIASRPEGPCIVDWSDARPRDTEALPHVPLDLRAYQPPEVIHGRPAGSRADVFALGVIAYEALVGARPRASVAHRSSAAPAPLLALLDRMMAHDPLARPTSGEVRTQALALAARIEVPLRPPTDDYGAEAQIVDVELGSELDAEAEAEAGEASMADGTQTLLSPPALEVDDRKRTQTIPPALQLEMVHGKPEPVAPEPQLSRTPTEPMAPEPGSEMRLPRTPTRIAKLRPPSPELEPSRTKTS